MKLFKNWLFEVEFIIDLQFMVENFEANNI